MNNAQVAVLVGSHRRESINAKLAQTQHSQVEWSAGRLPAPLNGDPVGNDTLIQIYLPSARRNSLHPNWSAPCLQGPSSNTPSPDSTEVEPARLRSRSRMYATAGRYAVLAKPKRAHEMRCVSVRQPTAPRASTRPIHYVGARLARSKKV